MQEDTRPEVRKVLIVTLVLNVAVLLLKVIVGIWTGALSLVADALHSLTDSANNILGLVAIRFASPFPDREHPYGHRKFEAVGAIGITASLLFVCFEIIQAAINRLLSGGKILDINAPVMWIMVIVLGINIFVAFYERRVGKRLNSNILIADAYHTMSDIWITLAVMLGLVGIWVGNVTGLSWLNWLDVIVAFPVAGFALWSAWEVFMSNLPILVDEAAIAPEEIAAIANSVPGVINCHDIASRGLVGQQVFIEMHMVVAPQDVETAHDITERVEDLLLNRYAPARITIHVEPPEYESDRITYTSQHE
ncbi:cation diffusion facilitator family transporter [Thalassoporum mexicanum PCC 7367]|uniref:cation diffusion facilitator family transporter n=1 Tax=Thalassoporum mexicanum TaxID=3457544 RepID=UPI00029FAF58|nr:cation diffusion facilitator family transporter [Pseudanabaena sp. PCC 7367]AFY71395.1 cation diffusion facilitator family transporter [Pseudanabaena sp. PCC 7367]